MAAKDQSIESTGAVAAEDDDAALDQLLSLVEQREGVPLAAYKRSTVTRRVTTRLQRLGYQSYREYLDQLDRDPEESRALLQHVTIKVGHFFRNEGVYTRLRDQLLPNLLQDADPQEGLHLWSAGCGNGEEAYTLSILLEEIAGDPGLSPPPLIYGTDVDHSALERAALGVYPPEAFVETPQSLLERHFIQRVGRHGPLYEINPCLRQRVSFARHDLLSGAPPWRDVRPQLILCRNVLIYFERYAQEQVLRLLAETLAPGGYLCLGESEQLPSSLSSSLRTIDRRDRLYRRE